MEAYLDNSATTQPCKEAVDKMSFALNVCWGNPSSLSTQRASKLPSCLRNQGEISPRLSPAIPTRFFSPPAVLKATILPFSAQPTLKKGVEAVLLRPQSSIRALRKALRLLKIRAMMSSGFGSTKEALLTSDSFTPQPIPPSFSSA